MLLVILTNGPAYAQGARDIDVHVSDGARRYRLGHWEGERLTLASPCIAGSPAAGRTGPNGSALTLLAMPGGQSVLPRQVPTGSEEWNRVAPALLALAGRREQEQRLAPATAARGTRFLDWLFAGTIDGEVTYYFESSRRVPSLPAATHDTDVDPPGTLRVDVSGFARVVGSAAVPVGTKAELRWEEDGRPRGPLRPDLRPFAIIRAAEPVWLLEAAAPASRVVRAVTVGARQTRQAGAVRIGAC
jgi:hypothetical protein